MNPSSRRDVHLLFQIINECGLDLSRIHRKKVLEIGPGLSSYTSAFIELGFDYWANEIGGETSDFLKRIFKVPVIQEPLGKIPNIYDGNFDLIFTKDSLEHHPSPAESIKKMKQLLSKDAWLIISVPNLNSYTFKNSSITHPYYAFPPHLNYFSKTALGKYLTEIGMRNIEARSFSFPGEIFYCMELCIKLGIIAPDFQTLEKLNDSGQNERLLIVAQNS
jgi:SAM-dependent methyltransferase